MRRLAPPVSRLARAALLAALLAPGLAAPSRAQIVPAQPPGDPVVARVDNEEIHLSDIADAAAGLPEQLRGLPAQVVYPLLLDQLISQKALAVAARRQGLDRDESVRRRILRAEEAELRQALLTREVAGSITEEALRQRYERDVAARPPEEEVHARHILLPTETEARTVLAEIRGGADFAEIARRRASGPGAEQGGDLGFLKRADVPPAFAEAAFALQPGQVSEPVHTDFGWHLIRVEARRTAERESFEEAKDQLRETMVQEAVRAVVQRIRGEARVERFNMDGTPMAAAPAEAPAAPAAPPAAAPAPAPAPTPAPAPAGRAPAPATPARPAGR
ncbi:peptidylprolyl isomerase [Roseomonas sp. NAR14]|uniref:Parvulin-like PPIase n=1 Tax=Roseomonas acroporae TaxID=2937791 RepID=A0A9X1YAE4_9PROT|nr:peptidylprolyl isomerase [Roseomonas acroporae]MCK8785330.1 peptidylprolyl isomerase [Roseomonas acroporae]